MTNFLLALIVLELLVVIIGLRCIASRNVRENALLLRAAQEEPCPLA